MSDSKYFSNYLGIVVQNNDPEKRGRVKVWVPHISAAMYDLWDKELTGVSPEDKEFVFPDAETNPDLLNIMPEVKKRLPWAEIAAPVVGGAASARFNAFTKHGTVSDSNHWKNGEHIEGFRPVVNYTGENRLTDAFSITTSNSASNRMVNPNAYQYTPSDYSNLARGEFSIPNVGAHVWVFFAEGDPNYPVVWAAAHGQEDWKRIFTLKREQEDIDDFVSTDYPGSYENLDTEDSESQTNSNRTFRSKHVLNTNKHVLEFVDTDKAEMLKMTHYSGSFLEFNNSTTSRLATLNDQLLVIGDQFVTVRKNQSIYVANLQDTIVMGDKVLSVGDYNKSKTYATSVLNILRSIHDKKRLFEIARTGRNEHTSTSQLQIGEPAPCPVCQGTKVKLGAPCATCSGTGVSPSSQWGNWSLDPIKWTTDTWEVKFWNEATNSWDTQAFTGTILSKEIFEAQQHINQLKYEASFGNGGDDISHITGNKATNIGTVFNDLEGYRVDYRGKIHSGGVHISPRGSYTKMKSQPLVEYVDVDSVPGGDWEVTVGNKYTLRVGGKGIQIMTPGPIDISGSIVNVGGESVYINGNQELLLESKRRTDIRGRTVNIEPTGVDKEVFINGNLGIAGNTITQGGMHVEGEMSYIHSTAPRHLYMTEIGYGPLPHAHIFWAPPWTLKDTASGVRSKQSVLNGRMPAANDLSYGSWIPT